MLNKDCAVFHFQQKTNRQIFAEISVVILWQLHTMAQNEKK